MGVQIRVHRTGTSTARHAVTFSQHEIWSLVMAESYPGLAHQLASQRDVAGGGRVSITGFCLVLVHVIRGAIFCITSVNPRCFRDTTMQALRLVPRRVPRSAPEVITRPKRRRRTQDRGKWTGENAELSDRLTGPHVCEDHDRQGHRAGR